MSSPRGAPRDTCVAGTPLRGPMTTGSGIWAPAFAGATLLTEFHRSSIVHRIHVVLGIDAGFDHRRSLCRERGRDRRFERIGAMSCARGHAEIMRRRLAIILRLQFGAVERELTPELLDFDRSEERRVGKECRS